MLRGKKIVLGVTGGIAAYKCPQLVRLLVKEGAEVRVVMSPAAHDFVTAKTLGVVSRNEVWTGFFDADHRWRNHVELAEWADLLLMAPLTANTLAKMASGAADNLLLAVYLSSRGIIAVAPAMDLEMYRHPKVKANLEELGKRGVEIIPAAHGELASGLTGEGRMAEPEEIVRFLKERFGAGLPLRGKKVLINAGPTYEPIDPVRFIGNRSSGKMGLALAEAFSAAGAAVTLVLGPTSLGKIDAAIDVINVETAAQMREHTLAKAAKSDVIVCAAAVADYAPAKAEKHKIKKKAGALKLELVRTPDILSELGRSKKKKQLLAGFALETRDLEKYAREKLKSKNLDVVIANLAAADRGIGSDLNAVSILTKDNKISKFELKTKKALAADIVKFLTSLIP